MNPMINRPRNKLKANLDHIQTLRLLIAFLVVVVVAQWLRVGNLQETRRIYIPPDLSQGVIAQFDDVPPPVVYTFSHYIFQQLNRWKTNGEKDYPQQIYSLQGFLTPNCIAALEDDMNEKNRLGELRSRVRTVQEVLGHSYQRERVFIETPESWLTWLDLNIQESIGGHSVKNVNVRYQLRIVKFDVDKEVNPWGLALSCNEDTQPILLTEDIIDKPFNQREAYQ